MFVWLGGWATPAAAQQVKPPGPTGTRAWAREVKPDKQAAARELFNQGNQLLQSASFDEATKKYRQALEHWDHPAVHYNLALALVGLDQPVEAFEHLEAALRYGPEPLGAKEYENVQRHKAQLEKQLARVTITCDEPGAEVTLDGRPLFVGPRRYEGMVRPGVHSVVASKAGFVPTDKSRPLFAGTTEAIELKLYTEQQLTRHRRPMPEWAPWAVLGAGAAAVAGGGLFHRQAHDNFVAFDVAVRECGGCMLPVNLTSRVAEGKVLQKVAYGSYAAGGAVLLTGAALLFFNQPQAYRISPESFEGSVTVTPMLGDGSAGAAATFRF
jgi:hypothetical protein